MIILLAILLVRLRLTLCQPSPPASLTVAILRFEKTAVMRPRDWILTDGKRLHSERRGIVFEGNFPSRYRQPDKLGQTIAVEHDTWARIANVGQAVTNARPALMGRRGIVDLLQQSFGFRPDESLHGGRQRGLQALTHRMGRLQPLMTPEMRLEIAAPFPLFGFALNLAQETQIVKTFQNPRVQLAPGGQQRLMCDFYHRIAYSRVATDQESRLNEAVNELLCRWCASKVCQWRALARRDATFRVDFHQLLEDFAERTLRRLRKRTLGCLGASGNGSLHPAKAVVGGARKRGAWLARLIQLSQRKRQQRQCPGVAAGITQDTAR